MAIDQSIERQLGQLRIWNIVVGVILAVQAILIAGLTNAFSLPVTATFMAGPPGTAHGAASFILYRYRLGGVCISGNFGSCAAGNCITTGVFMVQAQPPPEQELRTLD